MVARETSTSRRTARTERRRRGGRGGAPDRVRDRGQRQRDIAAGADDRLRKKRLIGGLAVDADAVDVLQAVRCGRGGDPDEFPCGKRYSARSKSGVFTVRIGVPGVLGYSPRAAQTYQLDSAPRSSLPGSPPGVGPNSWLRTRSTVCWVFHG